MAVETKQNILRESLRLFREKGFNNVSVEEICTAAGVTRGTFYYHYKTKNAILDSIYVDYRTERNESHLAELMLSDNHWEQLWGFCEESTDFTLELGWEVESWLIAVDVTEDRKIFFPPQRQKSLALVTRIIKLGQTSGQFRNNAPAEILARAIFSNTIGITYEWCIKAGDFPLKETIKENMIALLDVRQELIPE